MIRWIPWGDGELEVMDTEDLSIEVVLDRVQEAVEAVFSGGTLAGDAADDDDLEDFDEDDLDDEEGPTPAH